MMWRSGEEHDVEIWETTYGNMGNNMIWKYGKQHDVKYGKQHDVEIWKTT